MRLAIGNRCGLKDWRCPTCLGALLAVLYVASCARVADPVPPQITIPKRASELSVIQSGLKARLLIPRPTLNVDGSEVRKLQEIRIYRLIQKTAVEKDDSAPDILNFKTRASLLAILSQEEKPSPGKGERLIFDDPAPVDAMSGFLEPVRLFYAVEYLNHHKRSDGLSNIVGLVLRAIPLPPREIRAHIAADHIRLEWDMPATNMDGSSPPCLSGYWLFRSTESPPQFHTPVQPKPLEENFFMDSQIAFDTDIVYAIRVIGCEESGKAESALSAPLTVHPKDVFPPMVPEQLETFGLPEGIRLRWDANAEPDLLGYWLYRSDALDSTGVKLNEKPIQINSYLDTEVRDGVTYFYRLSAVDRLGNESAVTKPVPGSKEASPPGEKK